MNTYRHIVYYILDMVKQLSDDSDITEDHIIYLAGKYRALILKKEYENKEDKIPESDQQVLCLHLEEVDAIDGSPCSGGSYLRTTEKIPDSLIGTPTVSLKDFFQGDIAYISKERMRYVGYNKYLKNIIYCALAPDDYLYLNSENPQFRYLEEIKVSGVFEDPEDVAKLSCEGSDEEETCDILDKRFPLEDSLVPQLFEMILKDILGVSYRPKDDYNNATDDLSDLANFIRRNIKSEISKSLEQ